MKEYFQCSGRSVYVDKAIKEDLHDQSLKNSQFKRMVAIKKQFVNCDFRNSEFDSAYIRDCVFNSCDFTGCKFNQSNLRGSSFQDVVLIIQSFDRHILSLKYWMMACQCG